MKRKRVFLLGFRELLTAAAAVACLLFSPRTGDAQDLFRKSLLGASHSGSESFHFDAEPKSTKGHGRRNIPSWLEAADSFQTFPARMDFRYYDEDEREGMARRATVRMLGTNLEKLLKKSAIADAYDFAAEAVNRSKNLVTFAESAEKSSRGASSGDLSSFAPQKNRVSFGFDAFRAFAPTLSVGENARIISDHRKGYVLFEWRWGF